MRDRADQLIKEVLVVAGLDQFTEAIVSYDKAIALNADDGVMRNKRDVVWIISVDHPMQLFV